VAQQNTGAAEPAVLEAAPSKEKDREPLANHERRARRPRPPGREIRRARMEGLAAKSVTLVVRRTPPGPAWRGSSFSERSASRDAGRGGRKG
jgi:hypothetical protein